MRSQTMAKCPAALVYSAGLRAETLDGDPSLVETYLVDVSLISAHFLLAHAYRFMSRAVAPGQVCHLHSQSKEKLPGFLGFFGRLLGATGQKAKKAKWGSNKKA